VGRSEPQNRPKYLGPRPELLEVEPITRRHKPESGAESDSADHLTRLLAWKVELTGLVGSTEVPALLIPSDDSRPVTKTEFDLDKIWQYEAVGYDKNRVFLTEKNADLDHLTNPLATRYVQHHSDAAKNPDSHLPSLEKLYGDVYVVARNPI